MKKWALLLVFIPASLSAQIDSTLTELLDEMVSEDQKWRGLIRQIKNNEVDSISLDEAFRRVNQTDSANFILLDSIYREYGYVGYDMAGREGSHNFWLLVQHQDKNIEFQIAVLEQMKQAAENNNAAYQDYAYLIDRVKVNLGEPQIYGTQVKLNTDKTSFIPKNVETPDSLNVRRERAGLPPIEAYINLINKRYFGSLKE